ncbi:MAG: glycosyltransferase family 39 protein [Rudaea sp.]
MTGRLDRYALLLAFLSLLALGPMLQSGYFWGAHDARHSIYFLFEFDRVFQDGIWYPRWFADMTYGYGYPLFNIYGPLAFYVGEFFHLLGADLILSVKIVFSLAWIASGLAMYGFVLRLFGSRPSAFLSGLAYVFIPYHLLDVYVRAALAESVALVFLPLTLWAFYETVQAPRIRAVLFGALAYGGMLFAHNGIALLFSPVLGSWILFLMLRRALFDGSFQSMGWRRRIVEFIRLGLPSAAGLFLGLALTGIFLLPLALEYKYINVAQWTANYYSYAEHFVDFFQLFSPAWGFGISQPGPQDGLSFQLGIIPFLLAVMATGFLRRTSARRGYILFFLALTVVVVALMLEFSLPAWKLFGLAGVAQFPWRLLTLTTLSLSVLAGVVLLDAEPPESGSAPDSTPPANASFSMPALILGALLVLGSYPYITAQNLATAKEGPVGLPAFMAFQSSANEMTGSTAFADSQPLWSPLADNIMAGKKINSKVDFSAKPDSLFIGLTKEGLHTNGELIGINAQEDDTPIIFNVQYYPGWRAYLQKLRSDEVIRELPIEVVQPYGRIQIRVPKGEYWVRLRFEDTFPRAAGTVLSGLSLFASLALFAWDSIRRRRAPAAAA